MLEGRQSRDCLIAIRRTDQQFNRIAPLYLGTAPAIQLFRTTVPVAHNTVAINGNHRIAHRIKHAGLDLDPPLLRFPQGNIFGNPGGAYDVPFRIPNREAPVAQPAHAAIRANDAKLLLVGAYGDTPEKGVADPLAVVRVNSVNPLHKVSIERGTAAPHDLLVGGADIHQAVLSRVGDPENVFHGGGKLTEALLAGTQRDLGLLLRGDVASDREEACPLALGIGQRADRHRSGKHGAVRLAVAQLATPDAILAHRIEQCLRLRRVTRLIADDLAQRVAAHLSGGETVEPLGAWPPVGDVIAQIDRDHRIVQVVQNGRMERHLVGRLVPRRLGRSKRRKGGALIQRTYRTLNRNHGPGPRADRVVAGEPAARASVRQLPAHVNIEDGFSGGQDVA